MKNQNKPIIINPSELAILEEALEILEKLNKFDENWASSVARIKEKENYAKKGNIINRLKKN